MDDHDIEKHPDLMNPDWQRYAEKEAWTGLRRGRSRTRWRKRVTITAVALVVLAAAGFAIHRWGRPSSAANPGGPVLAVATTTAPSDLPDYGRVERSRPFDKTPAQNWAEGIAGLTVPPATKVGSFSAQQVGQAQDQVKQAVTVAQFDTTPDTPAKYAALFAADAKADIQADAKSYLTIPADGYPLLPVRPRMRGKLTVAPGKEGELVLHVAYVVAYAFDPGDHAITGPGDLEPFVRVDADYVLRSGPEWNSASRGLWVDHIESYITSAACDSTKTGRLKPAFAEPDFVGPSLTLDPGEFDPAKPIPTKSNCGE